MNTPINRTGILILSFLFAFVLAADLSAQGKRPPDPDVEGTPTEETATPPAESQQSSQESVPPSQSQETVSEPVSTPQESMPAETVQESQPPVQEESPPAESAPPQQETASSEQAAPPPPVEEIASEPPPGSQIHNVWIWQETQDCLWMLAKKYYNDPWKWKKIYLANRNTILDPTVIFPKQQIIIPPLDQ